MRAYEFINENQQPSCECESCEIKETCNEVEIDEAGKASRKICLSTKSDKELGASQLSSCKAQGLRARKNKKSFNINGKQTKIYGKKVKGERYGGPLKDWG